MTSAKTSLFIRPELSGVLALGLALLSSCAYRLPALNVPSQQRLVIVASSPERYVVRVIAAHSAEFPVASDSRVTIDVPSLPRACSVYLFDFIKIDDGVKPLNAKAIQLVDGSKVAQKLSLDEIAKLRLDASGYHILQLQK
jgi:hypothetical protein